MLRSLSFFLLAASFVATARLPAEKMQWPTPYPVAGLHAGELDWAQPTVSGRPVSATFGCVRNEGTRFHEGIDIRPYAKRQKGEATDAVSAAWSGKVVYLNKTVQDSSYGRYMVIEHPQFTPAVVSLYAHLASVDSKVKVGSAVRAGQRIGKMGRSAGGYTIPKERAHLHFEIGLRLSDGFQAWYDSREFGNKNKHGLWSGLNVLGLDPWAAWNWLLANERQNIGDYIRTLSPGFVLHLVTSDTPDIVKRYPALLTDPVPASGLAGWRVAFTGWGFPLAFTPLKETKADRAGTATVMAVNSSELEHWSCRGLVETKAGMTQLSERGTALVELLFIGGIR